MCLYGTAFLPVNFLFLFLGVLLYSFCARTGIALPQSGDELLTAVVASGALGWGVCIAFAIGLSAAAFSSADSALTALNGGASFAELAKKYGQRSDSVWITSNQYEQFGLPEESADYLKQLFAIGSGSKALITSEQGAASSTAA